jgi:RNA polymerase sigma-70 factor (family 1)
LSNKGSYHNKIAPELLLRISNDDEAAFAQLMRPLFDQLYGFAFSVVKSSNIAEEIVQDAFLRIWQHRKELPEIGNVMAWISTIVRNLAFNALRNNIREVELALFLDEKFMPSLTSAEDQLLFKESIALIQKAASALPPQQSKIFTLNRLDGIGLDEIALTLGLSKNTVKSHLTKAVKAVRSYIEMNAGDKLMLLSCLIWLY